MERLPRLEKQKQSKHSKRSMKRNDFKTTVLKWMFARHRGHRSHECVSYIQVDTSPGAWFLVSGVHNFVTSKNDDKWSYLKS